MKETDKYAIHIKKKYLEAYTYELKVKALKTHLQSTWNTDIIWVRIIANVYIINMRIYF